MCKEKAPSTLLKADGAFTYLSSQRKNRRPPVVGDGSFAFVYYAPMALPVYSW